VCVCDRPALRAAAAHWAARGQLGRMCPAPHLTQDACGPLNGRESWGRVIERGSGAQSSGSGTRRPADSALSAPHSAGAYGAGREVILPCNLLWRQRRGVLHAPRQLH